MTLTDRCQRCGVLIELGRQAHFVLFEAHPVKRRWTVCTDCGRLAVDIVNDLMAGRSLMVGVTEEPDTVGNGADPRKAPPLRWEGPDG